MVLMTSLLNLFKLCLHLSQSICVALGVLMSEWAARRRIPVKATPKYFDASSVLHLRDSQRVRQTILVGFVCVF